MLGKLFNLGAGPGDDGSSSPSSSAPTPAPAAALAPSSSSSPRPTPIPALPVLDSVHEDVHTRSLLFPDLQNLYETRLNHVFPLSSRNSMPPGAPSPSAFFDDRLDVELEARDLRVIVMQDSLGSVSQSLLYDSQASPPQPPSPFDRPSTTAAQDARRGGLTSPRKPSGCQNGFAQRPSVPDTTPPSRQSPHNSRRAPGQGRPLSYMESESQRTWREYREELASFSACIFGSSDILAYKGTSTKLHVLSEPRLAEQAWSALADARASVARSTPRASRLSHSFSSESTAAFALPPNPAQAARKKILITRLFPVVLPLDQDPAVSPQGRSSEDSSGFPFLSPSDDTKSRPKRAPPSQPRQKRTPMYAIALVVNLPALPSNLSAGPGSRGFRGSSSYTEHESLSSSLSSTRPGGWTLVSGALESPDSCNNTGDAEEPMDHVLKHWDIITRSLTHLQSIVSSTLYSMLRQSELASSEPLSTPLAPVSEQKMARAHPQASLSNRRSEEGAVVKLSKIIAPYVTLRPNCLLENEQIGAEVDLAKARIVAGLRASRVVTGQNRWPIWREEARWIAKWTATKNHGSFLTSLLTAFLATHMDWLQALSPPSFRCLLPADAKRTNGTDEAVLARTIIVSHDKMATRRLIFLLSAFLPASQQLSYMRMPRPGMSAHPGAVSQSPPSLVVPILKEESLRRKINRRPGPHRFGHSRSVSSQSQIAPSGSGPGGVPLTLAHLAIDSGSASSTITSARHERRASDATSVWNTNRPVPGGTDLASRKSGAAASATIIPGASIPHFATARRASSFGTGGPTTASSVAVDDLKRLARDDIVGNDSRYRLRGWGNVISGLLGSRKKDDAPATPPQRRPGDAPRELGSGPTSAKKHATSPSGTPSGTWSYHQMPWAKGSASTPPRTSVPGNTREPSHDARPGEDQQSTVPQHAHPPTPHTMGAFESPVRTSINVDDGVIDVDVSFPDYITSFETAVSSPSSSGYLSTPSLFVGGSSGNGGGGGGTFDTFEQLCRPAGDGEVITNVAGWLQNYHPDFVLQGLPPQADLVEQIKWSLLAEPTPAIPPSTISSTPDGAVNDTGVAAGPRWVHVSTAIVADTTTFTITRIRCQRLVQTSVAGQTPIGAPVSSNSAMLSSVVGPHVGSGPGLHASSGSSGASDDGSAMNAKEASFTIETLSAHDDALADAVERVISRHRVADLQTASTVTVATIGADPGVARGQIPDTSIPSSQSQRAEIPGVEDGVTGDYDGAAAAGSSGTPKNVPRQLIGAPSVAGPVIPPPDMQGVPRELCKTVILSALENLAQEVAEELAWKGKDKPNCEGRSHDARVGEAHNDDTYQGKESVLREATRAWLEGVKNDE